jgi:hypothetical protein
VRVVDGDLFGYSVFGLCSTLTAPPYAKEGTSQLEFPWPSQSRSTSLRITRCAAAQMTAAWTACGGDNKKPPNSRQEAPMPMSCKCLRPSDVLLV